MIFKKDTIFEMDNLLYQVCTSKPEGKFSYIVYEESDNIRKFALKRHTKYGVASSGTSYEKFFRARLDYGLISIVNTRNLILEKHDKEYVKEYNDNLKSIF